MDDWLQLTEEDIERATRLLSRQATAPAILAPPITITTDMLQPSPPQPVGDETAAWEQLMFQLVNAARSQHLPRWLNARPLLWDERLAAVARGHAHDMVRRQYLSHVSPEGVATAARLQQQGIAFAACGENIGVVYGEASHTAQGIHDIHETFMDQPRSLTNHRGNLLNPLWTNAGIGVVYNPDGVLVAVQNFICAPGARWLRGPR